MGSRSRKSAGRAAERTLPWLRSRRYDGLFALIKGTETCGCSVEDFAPCGDGPFPECVPAERRDDGLFYAAKRQRKLNKNMGSRSRKSAGRGGEITLAERIALELFKDGRGRQVDRLVLLTKTGQERRGEWAFRPAVDAIQRVITDTYEADLRALINQAESIVLMPDGRLWIGPAKRQRKLT
jgi:hypothetical protein